jgi:hypothetical protein
MPKFQKFTDEDAASTDAAEDDASAVTAAAAAFQAFMLRGKGARPPPSPRHGQSSGGSATKHRPPFTPRGSSYRPVFKALQGRLEDWNDTDRQLAGVMFSIHNLRCRLAWERRMLEATETSSQTWTGCGFRNHGGGGLVVSQDDIHIALDHDLLQHERMMASLRSLMASLAQTLDAVGRRLDEWMMLEVTGNAEDDDHPRSTRLLNDARHIYGLLSEDLYMKQVVVQQVLNSCHDGLLDRDADENIVAGMQPHEIAKVAAKQWKNDSSSSRDELVEQFCAVR